MPTSEITQDDVQRLFLQAVMSRRFLSEKLAKNIWQRCWETVQAVGDIEERDTYTDDDWEAFVAEINESMDAFDLEFRRIVDEQAGSRLCTIVNTKDDEVSQLASDYTPLEISYFKAVVEQIMLAPKNVFSISSRAALREVAFLKSNMTKSQAEVVLGSLVAKGWLLKSAKGRYSLAPRALLELENYLRQNYEEECAECSSCGSLITKGIACGRENCHTFMHLYCHTNYRRSGKTECPSCKLSWSNSRSTKPLGEAAAKDGQDDVRRVRRSRGNGASEDEDEGEDKTQEMDITQHFTQSTQAPRQSQRKSSSTAKKGHGRRRVETEEDSDQLDSEEYGMTIDDDENMAEPTQTQSRLKSRRS